MKLVAESNLMKPLQHLACFLLAVIALVHADQPLPPGVRFIPGPVNGVFIEREGRSLAVYGDPSGQRPAPDVVLLTHARRDVTWAARGLPQRGAKVVAPEKEAESLTEPGKFWTALR